MLGLAIALCLGAAPLSADTKSDLDDAMERVAQLEASAEAAYERFSVAEAELAQVHHRLDALTEQLVAQTRVVEESRRSMGRAARASYAAGGMDASLFLLLADDAEDFAASLNDLRRVSDAVDADLTTNREVEAVLARTREEVASQRARAQVLRDESSQASATAQQQLQKAQAVEAALERKYAAELAELRRKQEEAEARLAAAARAAAAPAPAGSTAPPSTASPGSAPSRGGSSGTKAAAVRYALAQIGDRYVWGAEGPDAFDCSGLVSAAYAAAGVSIPSYTGSQARRVRPVPLSAAQPGDLLFFFGRGAAHVAIYLGDGRMVHAVNPRRGVTVNSMSESWYRDRFTMAGSVV